MVFKYPEKDMQVMQRELQKGKKSKTKKKQERLLDEMSVEELEVYLTQRKHIQQKLGQFTKSQTEKIRNQIRQAEEFEGEPGETDLEPVDYDNEFIDDEDDF